MSNKPWHEQHPQEYERVRKSIENEFPYLKFTSRSGASVVTGMLPIVDGGRVIADFEIEIFIRASGPRSEILIVREIGGMIPHDMDRHNPGGYACLCVPEEFWYRHPDGMDLGDFLRGPVTSFFVSQHFYNLHGTWPYDERRHGLLGVFDFWSEVAGTRDLRMIRGYLDAVASRTYKPKWRCPCGSGRRVKDCHGQQIQTLRERIPREMAAKSRSAI